MIADFEALSTQHAAPMDGSSHRVLHYAALAPSGSRMDPTGHLLAEPSAGWRLKQRLHRLRTIIPGLFHLGTLFPELTLICRAPDGAAMPAHHDFKWRRWSAVVYLNDAFDGGETCFDNGVVIRPETGKLVIFEGSRLEHEVAPVHGGARYNLSFWWSTDLSRLEP